MNKFTMVCILLLGMSVLAEGCSEGSSWKNECNVCTCANGVTVCTKKLCPPGLVWASSVPGPARLARSSGTLLPALIRPVRAFEPQCEEGAQFREACNWCSCSEDGFKVCTEMLCDPAATYEGQKTCKGTGRFKDANNCNWCSCLPGGVAACTLKRCL